MLHGHAKFAFHYCLISDLSEYGPQATFSIASLLDIKRRIPNVFTYPVKMVQPRKFTINGKTEIIDKVMYRNRDIINFKNRSAIFQLKATEKHKFTLVILSFRTKSSQVSLNNFIKSFICNSRSLLLFAPLKLTMSSA